MPNRIIVYALSSSVNKAGVSEENKLKYGNCKSNFIIKESQARVSEQAIKLNE